MSVAPPPLVPADCDLTDFPFMPLEIARLRRSKAWLKAKRNPALAFYMVNLWTASWHDKPAGSLENDDDVIADLAMCDPAKWDKIKADVLHGWVLCDDGRLYNPTVAEKAREAWDAKLDQRWRTECARIKKHADRHHLSLPRPTFDEWLSLGCPQGQRLPVPRDTSGTGNGQGGETRSKGEGQGQGDSISVPIGTGGKPPSLPPAEPAPTVESADKRKARLWRAGKSLLNEEREGVKRMPMEQCGTYIGALARKYGEAIALDVLEAAVLERPVDPQAWIVAACQSRAPLPGAGGVLNAEQQDAESSAKADRLLAARRATNGAVRPAAAPTETIDV